MGQVILVERRGIRESMSNLTTSEIEEAIRLLDVRDPLGIIHARHIIRYADSDDFKNRLCEEMSMLIETMETHGFKI